MNDGRHPSGIKKFPAGNLVTQIILLFKCVCWPSLGVSCSHMVAPQVLFQTHCSDCFGSGTGGGQPRTLHSVAQVVSLHAHSNQ